MKKRKGLIIGLVIAVVVIAAGAAAWFFLGTNNEPVNVYPFQYLGMTEYWGDAQESYGPVTTSNIQTVFLTQTQTVTEIAVEPGQPVKKGDLLLKFDTTLDDIALERERLKVEKLKLDLQDAKERLYEIRNMKPMVIPTVPDTPEEEDLGVALTEPYRLSVQTAFDGHSEETALICWLRADTQIDDALLTAILEQALAYRELNAPAVPPETLPEETEPAEETFPEQTEPAEPAADPNVVYVVFKSTQQDMSLGANTLWQGVVATRDAADARFAFRFYDASGFADHTAAIPEAPQEPEIDFGSGFTADQLAEMRAQQEKTIRDLEFQIKMAEADYKIKQTEVSDGCVYSEVDGTVVSLLSAEEAMMTGQPFMKVSGGGGFYVEGFISELTREDLQIGQEVTVNDWNTGMTYMGTVESVGDIPKQSDGYYGNGNPNASYYPFQVFVGEEADLQAGSYVSVVLSAATAQNGIYLENPFLRTEDGRSYVWVRGADGTLEQRTVTTGKSLWGSYTEILSGLTAEDFLAFPYGKSLKNGAPTVEAEISTLYE